MTANDKNQETQKTMTKKNQTQPPSMEPQKAPSFMELQTQLTVSQVATILDALKNALAKSKNIADAMEYKAANPLIAANGDLETARASREIANAQEEAISSIWEGLAFSNPAIAQNVKKAEDELAEMKDARGDNF